MTMNAGAPLLMKLRITGLSTIMEICVFGKEIWDKLCEHALTKRYAFFFFQSQLYEI